MAALGDVAGEAVGDIAVTVACQVAAEWGLDMAEAGTRARVWAAVERYAHDAGARGVDDLPG
ncbi:MAG: hypothetical protein FWD11_10350 [Micrococcales bacterium]|nr:hypothetical protein [Micrococcales bacterium]